MVTAFVDGGYEQGPRTHALAVPEPNGQVLLVTATVLLLLRRRAGRCCCLLLLLPMLLLATTATQADMFRWDTGEAIPGTEGIEPRPEMELVGWDTDDRNSRYADFSGGLDLRGSYFAWIWLDQRRFQRGKPHRRCV